VRYTYTVVEAVSRSGRLSESRKDGIRTRTEAGQSILLSPAQPSQTDALVANYPWSRRYFAVASSDIWSYRRRRRRRGR